MAAYGPTVCNCVVSGDPPYAVKPPHQLETFGCSDTDRIVSPMSACYGDCLGDLV